jgi:hypothetical protein
MLGDSLTFTLGGSGGTAHVLNKINQDNYQAEYLKVAGAYRYRAIVKHSRENTRNGNYLPVDRHTVTFRIEYGDGTTESPFGVQETTYQLRCAPGDEPGGVSDVGEAMAYWATQAINLKLLGWES